MDSWTFLLLFTIIFVYQKKDGILYYLGFKINTNELTANQRKLEDKRINDIVENHKGKFSELMFLSIKAQLIGIM